ncbi:MAG TPA: PorV/PorQ family protein [Gemmatimonadales bacterium]|nr:PorV/PorQ family protein [Gemmatimonadales bacterium]
MKRSRSREAVALAAGLALARWAGPPALAAQSTNEGSSSELTNAGALFLLLPVGAQGVGMGQAGVTMQGRGEALFWNPAGLATMAAPEFGVNSANFVAGPGTAITMFVPRRGIGTFGLGVFLIDYGEQDVGSDSLSAVAKIFPRNVEYMASFATSLAGAVTVGMTYKLVQFSIDCQGSCAGLPNGSDALTHAFDIGTQVTVGSGGALRFGAAVKDIGFKLQVNNAAQADPLPARLALGALYQINLRPAEEGGGPTLAAPDSGRLGLSSALNQVDIRLAADLDRPWDNSAPPEMRLGIDLGYHETIRVRSGYAFARQGLSGPSIGMGVHTGSFGLDFSRTFVQNTDLLGANPTFISFSLTF